MREFPDIVIAAPNYSLWLWLLVPAVLAAGFFFLEGIIERSTEKRLGKPLVGIGFVAMGIALFVSAMSIPLVPGAIAAERNASAVQALEDIGFQDIRLNVDAGTFGAYYEGELMRGALIEDQAHKNTYMVVETPPPSKEG
ncbi:hypothetical protein SEA_PAULODIABOLI_275 [Microbacterium phage PauloDiaboli]|nr:hypothetical protein SEA_PAULODIABOLI_275 [Microbacterium phage PauloDiaboli]